MSTPMLAATIALSTAITFGLRALPFLIFSGERKMPDWLQKLLAVLVVAVSYHFKRSTFLSIFSWNSGIYAVVALLLSAYG